MLNADLDIQIDDSELLFKASRSGGPGGQHVNKVNTRITLLFDVDASKSLTDQQKQRIRSRLRTRIDKQGVLRVVSQKHRTQKANRDAAVERLKELLAGALTPRPVRKKTSIPRSVVARRLAEKKKRSMLKAQRALGRRAGDIDR